MKEAVYGVLVTNTTTPSMTYRPTIYVVDNKLSQSNLSLRDDVMCAWPHGMPPTFTSEYDKADVAIIVANGYAELLTLLPMMIDLTTTKIQMVICCDDYGDLHEVIQQFGPIQLAYDASSSTIAGVLFGIVERSCEVSKLRSEVGLLNKLHLDLQSEYTLFQDELEIAAKVQREFMSTEIQDVHGISFSSLWKPVSIVSGDMYDITQLDDDHVAIFIADAIGHGISAAMLAMMLMRTVSAYRFDSSTGQFTQPKEMLKHLNTALLERTGEHARFATAAYCIFNCKTNQLTYAGAGHPPALLSRFGHTPELLDSDGPLLGVFEQDDFPQCKMNLSLGDTLLLYSDGFEDALGDNSHLKNEIPTYLQSMDEFCKNASGDVLSKIDNYLQHTCSDNQNDDLTMICLKANTASSTIRLAA